MATTARPQAGWTVRDLHRRFGPIPFERIAPEPPPGSATEGDLIAKNARRRGLHELIDGILLKKPGSAYDAWLAGWIATCLGNFAIPRRLGAVLPSNVPYRISPDRIYLPDASYLSRASIPGGRLPRGEVSGVVPDLAVEILCGDSTRDEMSEKLSVLLGAGVKLVWYVDPRDETVQAFANGSRSRRLRGGQTLDGGEVLPGFALPLRELFVNPFADAE